MRKLTLDRSSKLFKLYRRSLSIWLKFTDCEERAYKYQNSDNLCHIVRTIFISAPGAVIAQVAAWSFAAYCALYAPIAWFGIGPYGGSLALLALLGAAIGMICWLISRRGRDQLSRSPSEISGLRKLLRVYSESRLHAKICPMIEFEEKRA